MIKPDLSSLFASRWLALGWGVVICVAAISFVAAIDNHPRQPVEPAPTNAAP